jgi:hypothetical protein
MYCSIQSLEIYSVISRKTAVMTGLTLQVLLPTNIPVEDPEILKREGLGLGMPTPKREPIPEIKEKKKAFWVSNLEFY